MARLTAALAGHYRIERELGAGGMATVYLAEDLKHRRKVALKVLKPDLAAVLGADRFVQEITTTASLSHPHILPLFDSGSAAGFLYYVMPYVQGDTLRDKLNRETQLGVEDAVRIATEVADALDYAHRHGVIHRDIKPENVLLHDGRPMVADFGIALAVSAAAGGRMTETGMSLGTPHYMSPEQATADKDITARSDVYSLASVLYEMLAGEPPHSGGSAQAIIMKIIAEPAQPVTALRRSVPPNVAAALEKALEKVPADRFDSARAFAEALANPSFATAGLTTAGRPGARPANRLLLGALAAAVGFAGLAGWAVTRGRSEARDIGLPPAAPITSSGRFALAPDGRFIVYAAVSGNASQLWYRRLDRAEEARPIPGTEGAAGTPYIAPDGRRIAFSAAGRLKVTDVEGGLVTDAASVTMPVGGEWSDAGPIFFGDVDGRRLRWVEPSAGPGRELAVVYCLLPRPFGAAGQMLCGGGADKFGTVLDIANPLSKRYWRRSTVVGSDSSYLAGSDFRAVDDRYLTYLALDGTLMATRIENRDSLTVGRSVPLVPGIRRLPYSGAGDYQVGPNGSLVYSPGSNGDVGQLVQLGRDGRTVPLNVPVGPHLRFMPSPDGKRLASVVEGVEQQELRIYDLATGGSETVDRGFFVGPPSWSPDGRRIAYRKDWGPTREGLYLRSLDSPGSPVELLAPSKPLLMQTSSYLADDLLLVGSGTQSGNVMLFDPVKGSIDTLRIKSFFASISPDRRWLAWQAPGTVGVNLQPWPSLDRQYLVAPDGYEPRWQSNTELVYQGPSPSGQQNTTLWRARIASSGPSPVAPAGVLLEDPRFRDTPGWSFALTMEGGLIYLQSPAGGEAQYVRVVPGWVKRMKRAVDEANR